MKLFIPVHAMIADGVDLKYALRSAKMYAPQIDDVAIIGGKKPTWYVGEHIQYTQDPKLTGVSNVLHKLRLACDRTNEDFVWSNDDIYWLKPWQIEPVRHMSHTPLRKGIHDSGWRRAIEFLKQAGIDNPRDCELHIPIVYNAPKLRELLDKVGITLPLSIRTLYTNLYVPNTVPLLDVKSTEFMRPKEGRPFYSSSDQSVTNPVFLRWCADTFPVLGDNEIEHIGRPRKVST